MTFTRRTLLMGAAGAALALGSSTLMATGTKKLQIGSLIFSRMDQIDFTGPFSVLSRLPDSELHVLSLDGAPIKDHKGLTLTPDASISDSPPLDVLHVPGGPGQEALMQEERLLSLIRRHAESGRTVFSVCTGALICGAAGILRGRRATTHWSALDLLPYFGATAVNERVVVDGNIVSAAGVTAGIDGALRLAALLRSERVAQEIQLDIQYAPDPPFNAGSPATAPREVLEAMRERYGPLTSARRSTAIRISRRLER